MLLFVYILAFVLSPSWAVSPVFGVLTQPILDSNETMVAASYVKWLEAGGARSIPIPYDAPDQLIGEIFQQIDGVLFPGGASDLPPSAKHMWKLLREAHGLGDSIPLWGTCLGFEFLLQLASEDLEILESGFEAENMSLPLEQVLPYKLYKPHRIFTSVNTRNITMNNHQMGISPEIFAQNPLLTSLWRVTSMNHDAEGRAFVSSIEPLGDTQDFPVFGVQFHPEKNAFEYASYPHTNIPYEVIDHSKEGIELSMYMASFAVDLARRNPKISQSHTGKYTKPDRFPLIFEYPMDRGIVFEQAFRIPPATHWDTEAPISSLEIPLVSRA